MYRLRTCIKKCSGSFVMLLDVLIGACLIGVIMLSCLIIYPPATSALPAHLVVFSPCDRGCQLQSSNAAHWGNEGKVWIQSKRCLCSVMCLCGDRISTQGRRHCALQAFKLRTRFTLYDDMHVIALHCSNHRRRETEQCNALELMDWDLVCKDWCASVFACANLSLQVND